MLRYFRMSILYFAPNAVVYIFQPSGIEELFHDVYE